MSGSHCVAVLGPVCILLLAAGLAESLLHARRLARVRIRIHVNGTRGKSTTTRLIAAGLREAGLRVVAKTTGTAARLILEDATERPVRRVGRPNIIEQVRTVALACGRRADALVVECMALHPENQWVSEHRLLHATVGVITNVRADHLDVMGPGEADVAAALSLSIPRNAHLVTAERRFLATLEERARALGTVLHAVSAEAGDVPEATGASRCGIGPLGFADNVACALKACELAGVDRHTALRGMARAREDPGALGILRLQRSGRSYVLVNAFAANDATSTAMIWERFGAVGLPGPGDEHAGLVVVGVMNNRSDRVTRVAELAALLATEIRPDYVALLGELGPLAKRLLVGRRRGADAGGKRGGMDPQRVIDLTGAHDPESVLDALDRLVTGARTAVLFGLGNSKGMGGRLADYFKQNGEALP